jgi:hypothetical protein
MNVTRVTIMAESAEEKIQNVIALPSISNTH